ncbi:anti-sigma regulatory factor [Streptomyces cinnamoneus]|uniref:Anti-sigma regulatory factor n=1 Tax=Streptomyces cinnamoneus TaxID=53446 RepID=A0A2G1XNV0_STRCJ|nr:sensor histidine kinase [Streptomyces cinnamoneus]PHQ52890.1 anti-sigma regulatory factor [Streptomyces cinnamoneus]PPT11451.1 sensor histidine kinase [Streptomyces cinnamoneus]
MNDVTAEAELFVHPALFYRNQSEYLAVNVPFIRAGLDAGEPVAVAVPRENLELLRGELGEDGAPVRFIDMQQAGRNPGRIIPRVLRAFADAHPGAHVRIIGEPVWFGRSAEEYPACVQHEALINHAFTGRRVTIVCPYDTARLAPQVLVDARATHPVVVADGEHLPSGSYAPDHVIASYNQPLSRPSGVPVFSFSFDAALLPDARHFVIEHAVALGLGDGRRDDLTLAVAELTTNSVVHGGGTGVIRIWAEDEHLVWQVEDGGHIGDPLAGRCPPPPDRPGGRGLLLVHYVSDLVRTHTRPGGTTTRCYLRR